MWFGEVQKSELLFYRNHQLFLNKFYAPFCLYSNQQSRILSVFKIMKWWQNRKKINIYRLQCFKFATILKIMILWTKPSSKECVMKFFKVPSTTKCRIDKSIKLNYFYIELFWELKNKLVLIIGLFSSALK